MEESVQEKNERLKEILQDMGRVLIAFSGGVDSTFLLRMASDTLGKENVLSATAISPLFPNRELSAAKQLAETMGVRHRLVDSNELEIEGFSENPPDRCYYCKKKLFQELKDVATEESISFVAEGSTVDDEYDHRPGRMAIRELGIRSPLKEALFAKKDVRESSKFLGLPTWDKPSFACLASRFPYGEEITPDGLKMVNEAEEFLLGLGLRQVRVRHYQTLARIEILPEEMGLLMEEKVRGRVVSQLKKMGYHYVTLDLQGFRSGSMNEVLR